MAQNDCPWQLLGGNRGSDTLTKAWLRANECEYVSSNLNFVGCFVDTGWSGPRIASASSEPKPQTSASILNWCQVPSASPGHVQRAKGASFQYAYHSRVVSGIEAGAGGECC